MRKEILLLLFSFNLIGMQTIILQSDNKAAELLMRIYSNQTIEIVYIDDKDQNKQSIEGAKQLLKKVFCYDYKKICAKNIFEKHWFYFTNNGFTKIEKKKKKTISDANKSDEENTSYPNENDEEIIIKIANFKIIKSD